MDVVITAQIEDLIKSALEEDIGAGDLTTLSTVPPEAQGKGLFRAKRDCIVAGLFLLQKIFSFLDERMQVRCLCRDGDRIAKGSVVAEAEGPVRALLMGERTALNFLQRLSGTATLTRRYVDAVKGLPCKIIDTRKTTPGLRTLEKYAVRMGGGTNHRLGLYDAALVKDNHIVAAGSIDQAVKNIRRQAPFMARVEVECADLKQVQAALDAGADVIMLDNMGTKEMAEAVRLINKRAWVEASGGITLERLREVAEAGVDFISVGALTHSAPAVDFNMKITASAAPKS
ncbi:MAG: carboxylating nicotinate-nucleotide diphosphorylase [Deltaproteobacteria bacterium]|nr:carboxylating nicotinate-nucleotide diphosphorylase [Deltaproteobacteria bacterium]MBI2209853.1 carboxylating nicotinate-nucleotide diphosphorylase [Deltaproteobacteria bacterium]MBI2348240.1 carboxylating nicotinate-nucleotide diphosphorylase [Deltaproteobacteria bacterium]MBI2538511.1 carboxylating nicotinate-nucleotide diphosphorylase [Deltaproteobacteria bacterium]MBI2990813.1 carboxylating nicotinate-nucleotide diphosphorylase [Deltaproteobacteria bacterium]